MASAPPQTFAALLRLHRRQAGLTQQELAEKAGLSFRTVSDLERCVKHAPRADTMTRLADALALDARDRARFAAAAQHRFSVAPEPAAPPASHAASGPPLVGRVREMAILDRHLAHHESALLLLSGEPGIGKSRLLAEAAARAQASGWQVLAGGCTRRSGQEPFEPFVNTLARALAATAPERRRLHLAGCSWLVRLLPELAEGRAVAAPTMTLRPEQERRLLFTAVGRYLANVSGPNGTLLVLDDLQWAGADALDLLAALVREAWGAGHARPSPPVRVVGAYRETEVRPQDDLAHFLADLARDGLATQRRIRPLAASEAAELLAGLLGEDVQRTSALREQIVQRTGGVPYFLVSYARALLASAEEAGEEEEVGETETTGAGGAADVEDVEDVEGVPWTVAHSIRIRIGALPPASRDLLGVVAVAGRSTPAEFLTAVTARPAQPEEALVSALEAACAAGLLAMQGADCQFTHDLIREVVLTDLSRARTRVLHRRVAEALERLPERGHRAADLAWHFVEAGAGARALPYALQAGEQAQAIHAHAEAEGHYRGAVELARAVGNMSREGAALEKLGLALRFLLRYDDALDALSTAAQRYQITGDVDALARAIAQIGWVHLNRGTPYEGITLLRSAVDELGAHGASDRELAGVYLALVHLCMHTGHHSEQLAATERALDLARRSGVEHLRRQAEQLRDFAHMPDRKDELEAVLERAARAEEAGDLESVVADLMINARVAETAGASVLATRCATRAREIAERLGKQDLLAMCIAQRGGLAMTAGQWKSARADFEQACALAPQTSGYHLAPFIWMYYGYLCLLEGEIAKGASLLEEVVSLTERTGNFPTLNFAQYALAEWDLMERRPAVARQRLERLVEIEAQYPGPAMVSAMCAWALLDLGEVAAAEALIGRVVEAPRTDLFLQNSALRIQAMVFTRQRRWPEAQDSIETSIAIARSLQYPFSEARGLYVCGLLYQAKGEPDLACEQFEQALAILRAMGERLYASRIERTLAELEARGEAV